MLNETLNKIRQGVKEYNLKINNKQSEKIAQYLILLNKWNKVYNLTAIRNLSEMILTHIFDTFSIVDYFSNCNKNNWLDIGSGGGIPGVPLAILFPEKKITVLDSNSKKTRFLMQVKIELELSNLIIINKRVQNYQSVTPYQGIISRAFSELNNFTEWTYHLSDKKTVWFAMKADFPKNEIENLKNIFKVTNSFKLVQPFEHKKRTLVVIERIK